MEIQMIGKFYPSQCVW